MMKLLIVTFVICSSVDNSVQDGYEAKRPQFFPIYPQKMNVQYKAGFKHTKDGVQAAYRNDQRQEYVNNVAYKHGTGLGTAPWYGVPGTAYDFGNSKPAGPTYHTDASHPNGYGYESSVPQYHSQPATYGHSAGAGHASGYKAGKEIASEKCSSLAEGYDIKHGKSAATYQPSADKPAMPLPAAYSKVIGRSLDGGYVVSPADRTYSGSAGYSKVGYDDLTLPAGYVSGSYEALGYRGYMY